MRVPARFAALVFLLAAAVARADTAPDRVYGSGYFRLMERTDFQGGTGTLGYWNLYGRLMNETPFAEFNLFVNLVQNTPGTQEPWARLGMRLAWTGFRTGSQAGGTLGTLTNDFQVKHFFLEAGNVFLKNVTWRFGTFDLYYNDLGLYDFRPSYVFLDTIGLGATYEVQNFDLTLVAGDCGWQYRYPNYDSILTGGGRMRVKVPHFELGAGIQFRYEPAVTGNQYGPYSTPGMNYQDYLQGTVVQNFFLANPSLQQTPQNFTGPVPQSAYSYTSFLYLGFGGFGAFQWDNFYVQFQKFHPQGPTTESYNGQTYNLYLTQITNHRYELNFGNQAQFVVVPDAWDVAWGAWFQYDVDQDNTIAPSDNNRIATSTVLRSQWYLTPVVHWIAEGSLAHEVSLNGNAFRDHFDSIFQNSNGTPNALGLQYGDSSTRDTVQLKTGLVLNPGGRGIFARPSIRILYGLQYSTQQAAYGNGFVTSVNQYNTFSGPERHWHSMVAVETEGWF
jgi:hypothetical protein